MRLTTVILIASLMQVSASTLAQKITLSKTNAPLKTILQELRQQSGYLFLYSDNVLKLGKPVDIDVDQEDFNAVLEKVFANQPLTYSINKKTIVIKEKVPSFLGSLAERWANLTVRGRVVDENARPLASASIQVKGKTQVYMSNEKGEFEIKGVDEDAVLQVSYVGYKTLDISLKEAVMPLEIKLNVQTGELQEVKVVYNTGYQELNKERATGSFVQIDNELFNRAVGSTVLDRILNVTSGLIANPVPGTAGRIVIRGFSTINSGQNPLIVVDNFPYEGDLKNLNPNDIESVTILKDAAAASVWGVRAGNGVIVINTKKGKFNQSTNINFNSNITMGQKPNLFYTPYISSRDMVDFEKTRFATGMYHVYDDFYPSVGLVPVLPQSIEILLAARKINKSIPGYNALNDPAVKLQLDKLANHDVRNDINKSLLENSLNQQYALNLSGGGNNFNYYASVGYDRNKGNNIKEDYNRLSLNFTNTWRPVKNLDINTSLVHTRARDNNVGSNYINFLPQNSLSPYTRLADEQGNALAIPRRYRVTYVDTASYPLLLDWHYKPLEDYKYINKQNSQYDTRLSAVLNYTIQPWLKAEFQYQNQTSLSNTRNHNEQGSFDVRDNINRFMSKNASGNIIYPFPLGDIINLSNSVFKAWNVRGSLKSDQRFGNHQISSFAGIELRETNSDVNSNTLYGYDPETNTSVPTSLTQTFRTRPNGSATPGSMNNPNGNLTRNGSFFANAAYNYAGKYLVTASGRIDQSNFFGVKTNLRRVPLWHAGLGWNLHLEDFYHIDWLSALKLKASYGYTGNTNAGASSYATFKYNPGFNNGGAPLMDNVVFGELMTSNNPQLRWERVKIINIGVEFVLKNDRINGSVEFYKKRGLDLLGPILTDPTTGILNFIGNQASIKGMGIDLNLRTRNFIRSSFEWNTDWLISYNKNTVTSYYNIDGNAGLNFVQGSRVDIGDPLNALYSFRWAGLDPNNGSPRIYLADTIASFSEVRKSKKEDLVFNGQKTPKIFGSLRNTLRFKQVSVSANITYHLGHYFRRNSVSYQELLTGGWSGHADYNIRWQKSGDEFLTDVPSLPSNSVSVSEKDLAYLNSNFLVEKADHIRLQDIRFDYRLDKNIFQRLPVKQVSFYAFAQNLGIIWRANKKGIDPQVIQFGSTPLPKTISFGVNANF